MAKRLQPPVEHPFGLVLLRRNEADRLLGQPLGREVGLDGRGPPMLIIGDLGGGIVRGLVLYGTVCVVGHASFLVRKSCGYGEVVSVREDLGGCRYLKKK